jgi:hypothetical protein
MTITAVLGVDGWAGTSNYSCKYSLMPNVNEKFSEIKTTSDRKLISSHLGFCSQYLKDFERDGKYSAGVGACTHEEQIKACAHCTNLLYRIKELDIASSLDKYDQDDMKQTQQNLDEICEPLTSELHPNRGAPPPEPGSATS